MQPRSPWLWSPLADLALGAGLLTLPLLFLVPTALTAAGPTGTLLIQLAAILCNYPHYAATLLRITRQSHEERTHRAYLYWGGIAGLCLGLLSLLNAPLLSPFFTLYMLWSPYHYAGQNYGIALLFLKRRGVVVSPASARQLRYGFHLSTLIAWIFLQQQVNHMPYLLQLPLARGLGVVLALTALTVQLMLWGRALYTLKREGGAESWHTILPTIAVLGVQCVWFSAFALSLAFPGQAWLPQRLGLAEVAFMHCAQYLWIYTTVSIKPQPLDANIAHSIPLSSATMALSSRWRFWLETVIVGALLWVLLPWTLSRMGSFDLNRSILTATVFINLHHFVMDGLIWKLRKPQVQASLGLTAGTHGVVDTQERMRDRSPGLDTPKVGWVVALLAAARAKKLDSLCLHWWLAGAVTVGILWLDLSFRAHQLSSTPASVRWAMAWNPNHSGLQTTLGLELVRAGKGVEAEPYLRRAVALDTMNATAWHNLGLYLASQDTAEAIACFEHAVALRPEQRDSWQSLGILLQQQHDPRAADAFERARHPK